MAYLKFQEVPQPLHKRIEMVWDKEDSLEFEPNCYGTAFFLAGVLPYDMVIFNDPKKRYLRRAIERMHGSPLIQDNSIDVFHKPGGIVHMAYIETAYPLIGYHRRGAEGEFEKITNFLQVDEYLRNVFEKNINFREDFHCLSPSDNLSDWAKEVVEAYTPGWDG